MLMMSQEAHDEMMEDLANEFFYTNESAVAFEASRREFPIVNQKGAIDAALAEGRSVIVSTACVYCPRTDAILGSNLLLVSTHATPEEANAAYAAMGGEEQCDSDFAVFVKHPKQPSADDHLPSDASSDDPNGPDYCPF